MGAKVFAETHGEKLKEVALEIPETQWSMCKADANFYPLANNLKEGKAQTSLETLLNVKSVSLVEEKEEALANKLTYTIR